MAAILSWPQCVKRRAISGHCHYLARNMETSYRHVNIIIYMDMQNASRLDIAAMITMPHTPDGMVGVSGFVPFYVLWIIQHSPWEKTWPPWLLTVSSRWPKWSQPAVIELWPGPWLSCDLAVTEPWSYWRCRDWAVTLPWLSCDQAVTEPWPCCDWAVTSSSRDWAVIIGPRSRDQRGHRALTVSPRWPFIFSWEYIYQIKWWSNNISWTGAEDNDKQIEQNIKVA